MSPAAPTISATCSLFVVRRLIANCCPSASSSPWSDSASASCGCCSSCWAKPALGLTAGLGFGGPLKLAGGLGGAAAATPAVSVSATAGGGGDGAPTGPQTRVADVDVIDRAPALAVMVSGQVCALGSLGQV